MYPRAYKRQFCPWRKRRVVFDFCMQILEDIGDFVYRVSVLETISNVRKLVHRAI